MNRRLRSRHRLVFGGLVLLIPVAFGFALSTRRPVPEDSNARKDLGVAAPASAGVDVSSAWNMDGVTCTLWSTERIVELRANDTLTVPDLLLYWSEERSDGDTLSGSETLLGVFYPEATHRYELPDGDRSGALVLYSLAHKAVVARADLNGAGG